MLCRRLKDGNAISLHEIRFFINTARPYYHFFCIAVSRFQMINSGCAPTVMGLIKADFSGPKHSGLILLAKSAQSIFDPGGYIVTGAVGLDDRASVSLLVVVFWHQSQDFAPRLRTGRNVSQLAFDLFFSCSQQQNERADLNLCSIRPRIGQHLMKVTSVPPGSQLL